jgi:hypothetical protein
MIITLNTYITGNGKVKWTPYIKGFEFGTGIKILQFKTKK